MPVKPKESENEREFIDYRFNEVFKRLDRMENTMNGFAFVKKAEYDEFTKEVREKYVTKESLTWIKTVVGGIAVGVGIAVVIAIFKVIGGSL